VVLLTLPLWGNTYLVTVFSTIALYTMVALGLVLLTGLAGQVSLGQGVFYGIGAYLSAICTVRLGLPAPLSAVIGVVVAGLIAAPVGRAILRLRGIIVAGVTLTVNLVFFYLVVSVSSLTGGATGFVMIPRFNSPGFMRYSTFVFYLAWLLAIVCLVLTLRLARSRVGRALKSGNLLAGAVFAGAAGAVYAHYITVIEPHNFGAQFSVLIAIMVVVGGVTNPWGAVLGAGLIVGITEFFREVAPILVGGPTGAYELAAYGIVLVLCLLFLPEGLFSLPARLRRRREA
jgi:branched-chain amino acid transport system permease protein